jgi:hypothetical protein
MEVIEKQIPTKQAKTTAKHNMVPKDGYTHHMVSICQHYSTSIILQIAIITSYSSHHCKFLRQHQP